MKKICVISSIIKDLNLARVDEKSSSTNEREIYGYIYRIFDPDRLHRTNQGDLIAPCYIGKTKKPISERFKSHIREAKKAKGADKGGDGKLHSVMWGEGIDKFRCEEIYQAKSAQELSEKEKFYQEEYQSIKYGWNKIMAPKVGEVKNTDIIVTVKNIERRFESIAHMCQALGVKNSTFTYWHKRKNLPIEKALEKARNAMQASTDKSNQPFVVYRRPYKTLNDAVRDPKLNKHKLHEKTIRSRIKRGISNEDAFSMPHKTGKSEITITTPDGKTHLFESITAAHKQLSLKYVVQASLTTVVSYINNKKLTPEQAFGFAPRPWEKAYPEIDKLIAKEGYRLIGKRDGQSKPVILHAKKEIYSSVKVFAKEWGIDYTTAVEEIKAGLAAEVILQKRQHPGFIKAE